LDYRVRTKTLDVPAHSRWGPDGEPIACTQEERIREEMIVATLDATLLARERSLANYMLRTRRPELFAELVRDQVSC
jgi:hypothetical protein